MIGKQTLIIDASEFLKGMSSGAEISDGGFSTETEAINPLVTLGVLYAPDQAADIDTDDRLTDEIIATSPDMVIFAGNNRLLVSEDAKFFRYNGTKVNAAGVALTATYTYAKGFTDIITYAGEAYITAKQGITRLQNDDTLDGGANFPFAFANTTYPHPALNFEGNAFFGDGNVLVRLTSAGGLPATIMTLSADQVIVALGIDPGTGKMLISTSSSLNISNTLPAVHKVLWYDGYSNKPLKSLIVDDMVTAFYPMGGVIYVGYGRNLGYLNGSGVVFLRKLANVTYDVEDLPYKHNFSHLGNTLYVVDGSQILAFGEVIRGSKIFYYAYKNYITASQSATKFKCIFAASNTTSSQKLGLCAATLKLYALDITTKAALDKFDLYTNMYSFRRLIYPRILRLEYADAISSVSNTTITYQRYPSESYRALTPTAIGASGVQGIECIGFVHGGKTQSIQFRIQQITNIFGLKRIILYYDYAE